MEEDEQCSLLKHHEITITSTEKDIELGDETESESCITTEVEMLSAEKDLSVETQSTTLIAANSTENTLHSRTCSSDVLYSDELLKNSDVTETGQSCDIVLDETNGSDADNYSCVTYLPDDYKIKQICRGWKDFECKKQLKNNFLKGCKWAPDGSCLLTGSEDKLLRIFNLPEELYAEKSWPKTKILPDLKSVLDVKEGGHIYDYCWYSLMNSWDPKSSCFFSTASGEPVHLWDAFSGELRATYKTCNYAEELMSPYCLAVCPRGEKLFTGFKNKVDIFEISFPGISQTVFDIKALAGQTGLVSTIAINPSLPSLFAVGTYQKTVGLYSENERCGICVFSGHRGGLTHMMFSPDGTRLYTGSRVDSEIVCWDLRSPGQVLFSLSRNVSTNQRIYFDLTPDGKYLISGNTDGNISIWNIDNCNEVEKIEEPISPDINYQVHNDCANGVSINQHYPVLATSSGQRHFPDVISGDNDDEKMSISEDCQTPDRNGDPGFFFDCDSVNDRIECCVKLWWVGHNE